MPAKRTRRILTGLALALALSGVALGCGGQSAHGQSAKTAAHDFVQGFLANHASVPHEPLPAAERELEQAALESPQSLGETAAHLFWEGWSSVVYPTTVAYGIDREEVLAHLPAAARPTADSTLTSYLPIVERDEQGKER